MILVTGAGGKTGKAVIKALIARGAAVRAFVRNPSHDASLKAMGACDVVIGEMDDPRVLSRKYRTFRDGRVGQGALTLTAEQQRRLRTQFSYYPDVDFDKYGI